MSGPTDLFSFSALQTLVALNLGATDNVTLAKCATYLNRALVRFSEMGKWSWQAVYSQPFPDSSGVTVANQRTYAVPNCYDITSLYISLPIQRRLVMLGDREYRRMYPNDTATGTPYYYLNRGRTAISPSKLAVLNVGLYPVPDDAYNLLWDGYKQIGLMQNATDDIRLITGMPDKLVDLVIEMATAIGWKEIDDGDAAVQLQEALARLKAAYSDDQHDVEDVHVLSPLEGDNLDKIFDPILPPNFGE